MCEHLAVLDAELKQRGIRETFRGQAWSDNCREWVYYDCFLDTDAIRARLNLPECISVHTNDDMRSGLEAGFVCNQCNDAIMGAHLSVAAGKTVIK